MIQSKKGCSVVEGEEPRPWSQIERVLVLALPFASSVFLGKLFSKPHSPLEDCDNRFFVRFNLLSMIVVGK